METLVIDDSPPRWRLNFQSFVGGGSRVAGNYQDLNSRVSNPSDESFAGR